MTRDELADLAAEAVACGDVCGRDGCATCGPGQGER